MLLRTEPTKVLAAAVLLLFLPACGAFSDGGRGPLQTDDDGVPLIQTCDAIALCNIPDAETGGTRCPDGMTKVAPPKRSEVYALATEDGSTTYTPGKIVPLTISVTRKRIMGKTERGTLNSSLESAKYLGLLLYAVKEGNSGGVR